MTLELRSAHLVILLFALPFTKNERFDSLTCSMKHVWGRENVSETQSIMLEDAETALRAWNESCDAAQ